MSKSGAERQEAYRKKQARLKKRQINVHISKEANEVFASYEIAGWTQAKITSAALIALGKYEEKS
jgi:hypothetical protein